MFDTGLDAARLYESIFHNTLESLLVADADGTILPANQALLANLKYQQSEITGKNLKVSLRPVQHDEGSLEQIWDRLRSGELWQGDLYFRGKETLYPLHVHLKPITRPEDISQTLYLFSARDVSIEADKDNRAYAYYDHL